MSTPTELTFEAGYTRLQNIADRVGTEEVPVAEMCDLFAEGKGLQTALTAYLDEQKERVEAIERGEGIQAFRIVPPQPAEQRSPDSGSAVDFPVAVAADDDIPF